MKKILSLAVLLCAAFSLSAAAALPSPTNSPDWFIFVDECGNVEVYDDGCDGTLSIYDEGSGSMTHYGNRC